MSQQDAFKRIPLGFDKETGLENSIPAIRVWGIVKFERSFSGNESSGINESFTDVEPFLNADGEIDARARIRATKLNFVRENLFRKLVREIARPYLSEIVNSANQNDETQGQSSNDISAKSYDQIVEKSFDDILAKHFSTDEEKKGKYSAFFKALIAKVAACSPADSCGACPACIAEGSASTTSNFGVSLPHNWEKKFKEIDFKTFKTAKTAANTDGIPVAGNLIELYLTEALVRNRTPRAEGTEAGGSVQNTVEGQSSTEGMMILREHMFSGMGYAKTVLLNPTQLEMAILADEWLVTDIRRGAKTSSGAGVWNYVYDEKGAPMIVVDEVLNRKGFVENPPIPAMPVTVSSDDDGIEECFKKIVMDESDNLKRYVGQAAIDRLKFYHETIDILDPMDEKTQKEAFLKLTNYCASVIARLIEPNLVVQKLKAEFEAAKNRKALDEIVKLYESLKLVTDAKDAVQKSDKKAFKKALDQVKKGSSYSQEQIDSKPKFWKSFNALKGDQLTEAFELLKSCYN